MIQEVVADLGTNPELFFRRFFPVLYAWVARASGGAASDVEDLVQEALLQAWARRADFRGASAPETWIIAIARHKILDRRRRRGPRLVPEEALATLDSAPLDRALAETDEVRARVRHALASLDPEHAALLRGRYLEGLGVRELASRAGESEKAVESKLHRAREAFRRALAEKETDHE